MVIFIWDFLCSNSRIVSGLIYQSMAVAEGFMGLYPKCLFGLKDELMIDFFLGQGVTVFSQIHELLF